MKRKKMKFLTTIVYLYILFNIINVILSKKTKRKPKCCIGTEEFGIGLYSTGMSCSDMINCCPSGSFCSSGKCVLMNNKRARRRKISKNYKNYEEKKEIKINKDEGPLIKDGDEIIKPIKIEKKPTFSGPVKINWKTFTQCLKDSGSEDPIIKDIINDYKKKKESNAMKKVFDELKKNTPIIVECLNQQEHLIK